MDALEREFQEATAEKKIPGVLLAAANFDGSLNYLKAFGNNSPDPDSKPLSTESTFCLASATKLVTCVAAMQCVERDLINLDDDITAVLPEWKDAVILTGLDEKNDSKPILAKAKNAITLRHLLSHTSGITGAENEEMTAYYAAIGDPKATVLRRYFRSENETEKEEALVEIQELMQTLPVEPLIFEPGTDWAYGLSTDWAGQIVERLTHQSLESYCQTHIFAPLSMSHSTFSPALHPHINTSLIPLHTRASPTSPIITTTSIYPQNPHIFMGGSNLYSSAPDYLSLLHSLLLNDGKILNPTSVDILFNSRLPDNKVLATPKAKEFFEGTVEEGEVLDHCLAGLVNLSPLETGRREGSVSWGGATRCFWWIDRAAGICGFYGSQIIGPFEGGTSREMFKKFEKAVYESFLSVA